MILQKRKDKNNKRRTYAYFPVREQVIFPFQKGSINFFASPLYIDIINHVITKSVPLVLTYVDENRVYNLKDNQTNLYFIPIGVVAKITRFTELPDGSHKLFLEGIHRVQIMDFLWEGRPTVIAEEIRLFQESKREQQITVALSSLRTVFDAYTKGKALPVLTVNRIQSSKNPEQIIGLLFQILQAHVQLKIDLLLNLDLIENILQVKHLIETENELEGIQSTIERRIKTRVNKSQKDQYLKEKIREIERELGKDEASQESQLKSRLDALVLPDERSKKKVFQEFERYQRAPAMTAESALLRTYLDWILDLPWQQESEDSRDILIANDHLNKEHYSLVDVKERILDFIAVKQLNGNIPSPILCFVGPPGTGKTSLGQSIANALNRKFIRISLGGIRDEAEIRGHRKTYVGALPGKIIQAIKRAETRNPVILFDEIDKIGSDYRGDPSSALLEVLDPEQNATFVDNYLEIPFDLSKVLFLATANDSSTIPLPLLDRMELLEVPSYTHQEKVMIANNFLLPKLIKELELNRDFIDFKEGVIEQLIQEYTRESGVRGLSKSIARLLRKSIRLQLESFLKRPGNYATNSAALHENQELFALKESLFVREFYKNPIHILIEKKSLVTLLGKRRFFEDDKHKDLPAGTVLGLAWTQVGGTILPIESLFVKGKGKISMTGKLGEVMKESASLAISYIRQHAKGVSEDFFEENDIHIHVPEGATPKDGPSAGTALTHSILSSLLNKPLPKEVAMTGEITLSGRILPVGGIREKVLAAYRGGIKELYLPAKNRTDFEEIDETIRKDVNVNFVSHLSEITGDLFPDFL